MGYTGEAKRTYQREWVRNNRDTWLLENGPCTYCGTWNDLELDHIDPKQKVSHSIWSWSKARRLKELEKCQVLCKPCHKTKTLTQRRKADHGSSQMYQNLKCRCDRCRAWKRHTDWIYRNL